jgi:hypothetical protein
MLPTSLVFLTGPVSFAGSSPVGAFLVPTSMSLGAAGKRQTP